jgi:carbon storage regulator
LTRKPDESITIGNHITVKVLEIRGNQVKLGIEAPLYTPVNRTEVYENILKENVRASQTPQELGPVLDRWPVKGEKKE